MFHFRDEIKKRLMDAVGRLTDYQVFFIAAYWFEKNVINETDMLDITAAIDAAAIANQSNGQDDEPLGVTLDCCDIFWDGLPEAMMMK